MITEKRYFVTLPPETLTPQQEGMVMLVNDLLGQDNSKAMRRLVTAALSRQQISPYKVAGQLGYSPRHGYSLREKLEQGGLAGLFDQPRPGRPPKIKRASEAEEAAELAAEPEREELGRTRWGGLWLLWPLLVRSVWWRTAQERLSFAKGHRVTIRQWLLTLVGLMCCGLRRLSHLDGLDDIGLALFSGRQRLMDQSLAHRLLAELQDSAGLSEATSRWLQPELDPQTNTPHLAIDSHIVPLWSALKGLPKCRVTTRGKIMRAAGLTYLYDLVGQRVLHLTTGTHALGRQVTALLPTICRWAPLRLFFDKGGYQGALFGLLCSLPGVTFITPAKNYAGNLRQWLYIPAEDYRAFPWRGQTVFLAETQTTIPGCPVSLRTVVLRKAGATSHKARFEAFVTNDWLTPAVDLLAQYGHHWRQETSYRVLKHDLALDALPKGYRFSADQQLILDPTRIHFIGWLKGMLYNLFRDFGQALGHQWATAYVSTLIRTFIHRPACLVRQGPYLFIELDFFRDAVHLLPYIEHLNDQQLALPELGGLILQVLILPPQLPPDVRLFSGPDG